MPAAAFFCECSPLRDKEILSLYSDLVLQRNIKKKISSTQRKKEKIYGSYKQIFIFHYAILSLAEQSEQTVSSKAL